VWGMLMLGVMAIAFIGYFGVSKMVATKARQTHALDAAAYSAALFQARTMNMISYINRAQVANQVAMAHLTTLSSWSNLGETQARQLLSGNPPAHVVGMLFGADHGAAYSAARQAVGLASTQSQLASAYMAHDHTVRQVLGRAQAHVVDTMVDARHSVIQTILNANYEASRPSDFRLEYNSDDWSGTVIKLSGPTHLAPVVRAAVGRFGFLAPRNDIAYNKWVVSPLCPGLRHQLRRRGATQMDEQGRWQSTDTLSYHALRSNRWIGCYFREYPMGWGWLASASGQALDGPHMPTPPDDFSETDFWRWVQNNTDWDIATGSANPLASSRALVSRRLWETTGLPGFFDLAESTQNAAFGFSLTLYRSTDDAQVVTTRSAAETFFARPAARADGRAEQAGLFRPYWQARLAAHPYGPGAGAQP
jgi:hypothetical protein